MNLHMCSESTGRVFHLYGSVDGALICLIQDFGNHILNTCGFFDRELALAVLQVCFLLLLVLVCVCDDNVHEGPNLTM